MLPCWHFSCRQFFAWCSLLYCMDWWQEWEMLVLQVLRYDICAITPHDFVDLLLSRLPISRQHSDTVRQHTQTFIALCATGAFHSVLFIFLPWSPMHTHTHTRLTALCPGLPRWASTRKVKPIWILLKQETVSSSRIHWTICKSAPRSRQITTPAPHRWVFYRPDALPVAQSTVSKHWRHSWSPIHVSDFSLRC